MKLNLTKIQPLKEFYIYGLQSFMALCFLFFTLFLVHETFKRISFPFSLEYREAAILSLQQPGIKFNDWFSADQTPENLYVYGFVYPLTVKIFPHKNKLKAARYISSISNFCLVALILFSATYKKRESLLKKTSLVLMGFSILYLAEFRTSSGGFPSGLGQFLFSLSIILPMLSKKNWSLIFSALTGILAFYTKPYFAIALPLIASYLLIFESKQRAFFLFNIACLIFFVSLALINNYWPGYYTRSFFVHLGYDVPGTFAHMYKQIKFFLSKEAYLIIALLMACLIRFPRKTFSQFPKGPFSFKEILINDKILNVGLWVFALCSCYFLFSMGKHVGAHSAFYLYHLSYPFMILILIRSSLISNKIYWTTMLFGCLYISQETLNYNDHKKVSQILENQRSLAGFIEPFKKILNTGDMAYHLYSQGKKVHDNGQTEYFKDAPNFFMGDYETILGVYSQYNNSIMDKILKNEFQILVINPHFGPYKLAMNIVQENYSYLGKIHIMGLYNEFDHDIYSSKKLNKEIIIPPELLVKN